MDKKIKDRESKSLNNRDRDQASRSGFLRHAMRKGSLQKPDPNLMIATSLFFTPLQLNREVGKYSVHEEIGFEVGVKGQARFSMTEKGRMEGQNGRAGWRHRGGYLVFHTESFSGGKAQKWKLQAVNSV